MSGISDRVSGLFSLIALAIVIPSVASANRIDLSLAQPTMINCEDEVQLHANDGSMSIQGELVAYDKGVFRLKTALGDMAIDAATVRCEGAACPTPADVLGDIQATENVSLGNE